MRMSRSFTPTLKEVPADATVASHQLLVRAGYIRQLSAGLYSILPLGQRSILKIIEIVREEMNAIDGAGVLPAGLASARDLGGVGPLDGDGREHVPPQGPQGRATSAWRMTHEEIFTVLARDELRSYRQLPQIWYQIQTKFRDEPRPKSGPAAGAAVHHEGRLLVRRRPGRAGPGASRRSGGPTSGSSRAAGSKFVAVEAHSGAMGGSRVARSSWSATDAGEDLIASCESCGYAANTEKAHVARRDARQAQARRRFACAGAIPHPRRGHHRRAEREAVRRAGRPAAQDAGVRRATRSR